MEKLLLLCVIMCCGFAAGLNESKLPIPVNEPGFRCLPNSQFLDDCNTCTCDASGALARCTAMACDPSERTKRAANEKCVPGTSWNDGCNNCYCNANRLAYCTKMMCIKVDDSYRDRLASLEQALINQNKHNNNNNNNNNNNLASRVIRNIPAAPKCVPGSSFMKDCNRCICGNNGIAACTLMGCLPKGFNLHGFGNSSLSNNTHGHGNSTHRRIRQTKQTPVPTEHIYTQAELDSPNFTCTPSQSFKLQCNTCWCAADGKRARFCTRLPCPKTI